MTFLDPRDGRPAHLRAVPRPTERHLEAIDRANPTRLLRLIQAAQEASTTAAERAASARAITDALPDDQKPGQLHTVTCDENGIGVQHCVVCGMSHYTLWDRVTVEQAPTADERYIATWPCPFDTRRPATFIDHILGDVDFMDAVEGGAELIEDVDHDAQVLQLRAWLRHPAITATAFGKFQGPEDAA